MHESRSTLRSAEDAPICRRSDGNGPSSRSMASRSSGTAQISECTSALTSAHHAAAAVLAARTSTSVPARAASVSSGTARSRWA